MTMSQDLIFDRADLSRIIDQQLSALEEGELLLAVEKFGITANTVTYGVIDPEYGYWQLFPAPEGWGRLPVPGYARVIESRHSQIGIGERLSGFVPMSTRLIVRPDRVSHAGFLDVTPTRRPKWLAYNQYERVSSNPHHDIVREDDRLVFGFVTGYLAARMFARADWYGASTMIVLSASSKTALTLAHSVRQMSPCVRRMGMTSARNRRFVESTGLYDEVLDYDAMLTVSGSAVLVDIAA